MSKHRLLCKFLSRIRKTDSCWLWTGSLIRGYGQLNPLYYGERYAHRYSWREHIGQIPDGIFVLHKCDTPACVNPDHLFLGIHADNMRDGAAKGRINRGSKHPMAKLNDDAVSYIVKDWQSGWGSGRRLARKFNVTEATISLIGNRRIWKHVDV